MPKAWLPLPRAVLKLHFAVFPLEGRHSLVSDDADNSPVSGLEAPQGPGGAGWRGSHSPGHKQGGQASLRPRGHRTPEPPHGSTPGSGAQKPDVFPEMSPAVQEKAGYQVLVVVLPTPTLCLKMEPMWNHLGGGSYFTPLSAALPDLRPLPWGAAACQEKHRTGGGGVGLL